MKTVILALSLALSSLACDGSTALLPDCPVDTSFAPCTVGNTSAPTGRATCWKGLASEHLDPAAMVVGCFMPSNDGYQHDECVAECVAGEGR